MKLYIDFDSTLFHTKKFTITLLETLTNSCLLQNKNLKKDEIFSEAKSLFNRENIYNIYALADYFAEKYNLDTESIKSDLHKVVSDGKTFVFEDVIPFLEKAKQNNTLILFTFSAKESFAFQLEKIMGSGLANFFHNIFITSQDKHCLDLNYSEGIFIDDNPDVISGIIKQNPKDIYRIKRVGTKYYDFALPKNIKTKEIFSLNEFNF